MENQLATLTPRENFLPVLQPDDILNRHAVLLQFKERVLREGVDYGSIPGTGDKPTLLKAGAEKFCTIFGLTTRFEIITKTERFCAENDAPEPFFYYHYRCSLSRGDYLIAQGEGSANSYESKYRWRKAERVCAACGQATIIKGKAEYGGGWICFARKGGCGAKFADGDAAIEGQTVGRIPNPDIADLVNTLMKMAQKRALVAATLIAVNASEFFTQDVEDFSYSESEETPQPAKPRMSTQREASPAQNRSAAHNAPAAQNAPSAVWNGDNESPAAQREARQAAASTQSSPRANVSTQTSHSEFLSPEQLAEIKRLAEEVFPTNTNREMNALLPGPLGRLTIAQANKVIAALDSMKRQFERAENLSTQASPSAQEVVEGEVADAPAGAAPEGVLPMTVKKTVPAGTVAQVCRGCQNAVYFVENGKGGGAFYDSDGTPHAETCTNPQSFAKRERPETRVFAAMNEMGLPSEPREIRLAAVNAFLADNNWQPVTSFSQLPDGQAMTVATAIKMRRITWGGAASTQQASQQEAVAA